MKNIASINSSKFFLKNSEPYNAFICLGKNFIEIAVTDIDSQKIEVIQSFQKDIGNVTRNEAMTIFQLPDVKKAKQVYIGLESNKFTLIPEALYQNSNLSNYLSALYDIESSEEVISQKITPEECYSVFTIKKGTKQLLQDEIGDITILHTPSTLLIAYQQILPPNKELYSFIRFNDNDVTISFFKNKKLQLHQSYQVENVADALYHYLHSAEILGLDKSKLTATLFGRNLNIEKLKELLDSNVGSVKFMKRLPTLQYTDEIFSQPAHRFFNLFSLVLCA